MSAMDNETLPTDLTHSCKQFINSKTTALAEQELNLQFENCGMTKVSFMTGYTSNMYHGLFLWSSTDNPSNHLPFSFSEAEPIWMEEHKSCHLLLLLILTQGKGMTVDKIKASSKQEVHAPMNIYDMAKQLKMFTIAKDIFLGEFSMGSQCLRSLQTNIDCNRSSFKAWECLAEDFASKLLFAVNLHYQIWLKQCQSARNCRDVDDSIINFSQLVSQVLFSSFHITLPPTFKMKEPQTTTTAPSNGKMTAAT
jgi:hypothetical protein